MNKQTKNIQLKIKNLDELADFSLIFSKIIFERKCLIFLNGALGAGKTTFTQMLGKNLGVVDIITSPTFNIFKRYKFNNSYLNHFDLYRIEDNVYDQGFEEYWHSNDITIIEWSIFLPDEFQNIYNLKIDIEMDDEENRILKLDGDLELIDEIEESANEFIY